MVCVIFIPVLYIIMISFKIQAQAIASHAFVIPFNAGHGANSDSVSMPPCDFPFPLIYYSVLSAYKIPASVGCKSADHGPGAAARSCQAPGGLHAGTTAVTVKDQDLIS